MTYKQQLLHLKIIIMEKTIDERLAWVIKMLTDFELHKVNKGDVLVPLGVCVSQLNKIIEVVQNEVDQEN